MSAPELNERDCLAVSLCADFYPEDNEADENREHFTGQTITWTFECPRKQPVGPGVYRLTFVRTLAEEKALGNPVLRAEQARAMKEGGEHG